MDYTLEAGRLYLHRSPAEREPLLQRLRRIEGQVRGLQQMIEQDRHCLDEVTQVNATVAALREVAVLLLDEHLRAGVEFAIASHDEATALDDLLPLLRAALRQ